MAAAILGGMALADRHRLAERRLLKISGVDAVVYYAVSRSLLFDFDVELSNEYQALKPEPGLPLEPVAQTGHLPILFPIGFSLLELPFLAVAVLLDAARGTPVNGYSQACFTAWYVGMVTMLAVGLSCLFLWLRDVAAQFRGTTNGRDLLVLATTLIVWPSTTLGYYTFSPMSHVAAFAATSAFIMIWFRARDSTRAGVWAIVGASAGLAAICRWQEVLLLLLPATWDVAHAVAAPGGSRPAMRAWLRSRAAAAAAFLVVFTPQMLEWHAVFGRWLTIPQGEGFVSFPPRFVGHVLFSSYNGWFLWTPITAIGMVGLLFGLRRAPRLYAGLVLTLGAEIVLVGGVVTWYGHWFGLRYLTSMTPLVAAGLLALVDGTPKRAQIGTAVAATVCAAYTVLFAVQYRFDLVPRMSTLTIDELLWDKIDLRRAIARRDRAREGTAALKAGDAKRALAIAEQAVRELGASDALLDVWIAASQSAGDASANARAVTRAEAYHAARLY
jgi:hypothetical protein